MFLEGTTTAQLAARFREMKAEPIEQRLSVRRSAIHGWGLFARRPIPSHSLVIEYTGEVVRGPVADQRELQYERLRLGGSCYLFRLDDEHIVDATMCGSAARFINHSQRPNCDSRIVNIDGTKHIVIVALRNIAVGEEITYDYKFPFDFTRDA